MTTRMRTPKRGLDIAELFNSRAKPLPLTMRPTSFNVGGSQISLERLPKRVRIGQRVDPSTGLSRKE